MLTDLRDRDALAKEVLALRPDAAVHLAGISFVAAADERAFYDVNLFGALNLVDALKRCGTVRRALRGEQRQPVRQQRQLAAAGVDHASAGQPLWREQAGHGMHGQGHGG